MTGIRFRFRYRLHGCVIDQPPAAFKHLAGASHLSLVPVLSAAGPVPLAQGFPFATRSSKENGDVKNK